MDRYEEAVMDYICADAYRFVKPQCDIPYEDDEGGSCPDFVVIDYRDKFIYVVEVTTSSNTRSLIEKINERQTRWISPLKKQLGKINSEFLRWKYHVTVFVRKTNQKEIQEQFNNSKDISIKSIEDITFPYLWTWNGEVPCNPLR